MGFAERGDVAIALIPHGDLHVPDRLNDGTPEFVTDVRLEIRAPGREAQAVQRVLADAYEALADRVARELLELETEGGAG